jgi:hypothetical protein
MECFKKENMFNKIILFKDIMIALIGAIPPTIMAAAAWKKASRLTKPLNQVNTAVNHRNPNQKTLIETVDIMANQISELVDDMKTHRAWHQENEEK